MYNSLVCLFNIDTSQVLLKAWGSRPEILPEPLLHALLNNKTLAGAAKDLKCSTRTLQRHTARMLQTIGFPIENKTQQTWHTWLVLISGLKACSSCTILKELKAYSKDATTTTGLCSRCRECNNTHVSTYRAANPEKCRDYAKRHYKNNTEYYKQKATFRRASLLKAIPKWADLSSISEFYKNRLKGYHVDHIVPLSNPLVCGLHVLDNLQYLTTEDNLKKSNKWEV